MSSKPKCTREGKNLKLVLGLFSRRAKTFFVCNFHKRIRNNHDIFHVIGSDGGGGGMGGGAEGRRRLQLQGASCWLTNFSLTRPSGSGQS